MHSLIRKFQPVYLSYLGNRLIHQETEVIPLFKEGDESAFLFLYERFQASLFQRAMLVLDNQGEAEDVTAESFVKLWNARNSFESIAAVGSWLKITTRNAALDILKHRKIVADTKMTLMNTEDTLENEWTHEDLFAEGLQEIYKQIELLPEKSRKVFKLRYLEGLRNEEIASLLAIHSQSVRDHLSRSLKTLRAAVLKKENLFSLFLILLNTK